MRCSRLKYLLVLLSLMPLGTRAGAKELAVTQAQVDRLEVRLQKVQPAQTEAVALLPATVVPATNARVVAAAPFAGTVTQMHVLPGQAVRKGEPLVTVASREFLEAMSRLNQSKAELQMAETVATRARRLADKDVAAPVKADEAEAQVAKIRALTDDQKRLVAIGGISQGGPGNYTLPAPADGRVVETRVLPGEKLDAMGAAVVIDTSEQLWLEAQVPADLIGRIHPGDRVQVADGPIGKVISIGRALDRMTRSATMLADVPPRSGLVAGQMIAVSIIRPSASGGLDVPATSVAWIGESNAVFVRNEKGFNVVPVKLRGKTTSAATIEGDLTPGQMVAASGLSQLENLIPRE